MALIVLCSASGSPGVTTTALALALTWPRPVLLVEADPTGGSAILAGYFRGALAPPGSLVDLAFAHRAGTLSVAIPAAALGIPETTVSLLTGVLSHQQARSVQPLWAPLAVELSGLEGTGQDVIVDAGRLGLAGSPEPLLHRADRCLLVCRSDLVALSGARSWAQTLHEDASPEPSGSSVGVVLVGPGRPYTAREVTKVLGLPVLASIEFDAEGAAVFAHGANPPRRWEQSPLLRSLRSAGESIRSDSTRDQDARVSARPVAVGGVGP